MSALSTVQDLREALSHQNGLGLDVREPEEYRYERIPSTVNIPVGELGAQVGTLSKEREIYVFCQTGIRTQTALDLLRIAGFTRLHEVSGGVEAWKSAGLPIEKTKGPLPVMRQVHIAAGSLVFVSSLFAQTRWLALFVGAGLIFSGVTGFCGMAHVLSKMPWNKSKAKI